MSRPLVKQASDEERCSILNATVLSADHRRLGAGDPVPEGSTKHGCDVPAAVVHALFYNPAGGEVARQIPRV